MRTLESMLCRGSNIRVAEIGRYPDKYWDLTVLPQATLADWLINHRPVYAQLENLSWVTVHHFISFYNTKQWSYKNHSMRASFDVENLCQLCAHSIYFWNLADSEILTFTFRMNSCPQCSVSCITWRFTARRDIDWNHIAFTAQVSLILKSYLMYAELGAL